MDTQFKKGIIELCVLSLLKDDMYGYEIVNELNKHIEVSTNTVYPILRRLTNDAVLATYEMNYGDRKRKYYTLTSSGKKYLQDKLDEWFIFTNKVELILKRGDSSE